MSTRNRTGRQNQLRQLMAGIDKHLTSVTTVTLAGADVALPQVKAQFQADVDASDASVQARANLASVVQKERDSHSGLEPTLRLFKSYVISHFGDTNDASSVLADFGLKPRASRKRTAAEKADAVEKGQATRAARHTMGPKERQKVKGAAPVEPPPTPVTPSPAPAPKAATPTTPGATPTSS